MFSPGGMTRSGSLYQQSEAHQSPSQHLRLGAQDPERHNSFNFSGTNADVATHPGHEPSARSASRNGGEIEDQRQDANAEAITNPGSSFPAARSNAVSALTGFSAGSAMDKHNREGLTLHRQKMGA